MNPRKPTSLKLIQGTFRKDRATKHEPRPEIAVPVIPEHLQGEAKVEWERVTVELANLGLLTRCDRSALAAYCDCWADYVAASIHCANDAEGKDRKCILTNEIIKYDHDGTVVSKSGGNLIENPYFSIKKRCLELMHKFLTEFGMTPVSRTKINANPKDKEDDFEGFVKSRKTKA